MNWAAIGQGLLLVFLANGAPLLAARLFGRMGAYPIDFHLKFADGAPVLGASKTFRGVAASLAATTLAGLAMGLSWHAGAVAAAGAMAGDAFSSFVKRRCRAPSQSMAPGLDQGPESLVPLLLLKGELGLGLIDVIVAVLLFWIGALLLSRALYALKLRERPY